MKDVLKSILYVSFLIPMMVLCQRDSGTPFIFDGARIYNPAWQNGVNRTNIWLSMDFGLDTSQRQSFFFNTEVSPKMGFGLILQKENSLLDRETIIGTDFNYKIPFNNDIRLSIGLRAGGSFYKNKIGNLSAVGQEISPTLSDTSRFNANFGLGIHLEVGDYFLALGVPRILRTFRLIKEDDTYRAVSEKPYYFLMGGSTFLFEKWSLESAVQFRYVSENSLSEAISILLEYDNTFSFGGNYEENGIFSGVGMWHIRASYFKLGYAYGFNTNELTGNNFNIKHELTFSLEQCPEFSFYSFHI